MESRNNSRPAKKASTLDPSLLVKEADHGMVEKVFRSDRLIKDLPIDIKVEEKPWLQRDMKDPQKFRTEPWKPLLEGRDILGIAQTGTGKTAAFLIPIIEQLLHKRVNPYALVVVPTRELALQVEEEFKSMAKGLGTFQCMFYWRHQYQHRPEEPSQKQPCGDCHTRQTARSDRSPCH